MIEAYAPEWCETNRPAQSQSRPPHLLSLRLTAADRRKRHVADLREVLLYIAGNDEWNFLPLR